MVEGNYDEDEIQQRIKEKEKQGAFINEYRTLETHLSVQQATDFLLNNMGNNSEYEFIHQHKEKGKVKNEY